MSLIPSQSATASLISTSIPLAVLVAGSSIEWGATFDSPSVIPSATARSKEPSPQFSN
jgi:hypothetical protein